MVPQRRDPNQLLGPPDVNGLGLNPERFTTLGRSGGEIVVAFRDNILSNSGDAGPELSVTEIGDVENFNLFVFPYPETELILQEAGITAETDGSYLIASNVSTASIDIDPVFGNLFAQGRLQFAGVRIVSVTNSGDGPDIDALTANFSQSCSEIRNPSDYSDAPIAAYGEASHEVADTSIFIGSFAPDAEPSARQAGNSGADADGDDTNGIDDEDGITIPALMQRQTATITAEVTGAGGFLQGWIDFNGDGTFEAGEQIAANLQDDGTGDDATADDGTITFDVVVPSDATSTQTFARFRWSTTSGLDATAVAPDGEVEDYAVTIAPVAIITGRVFDDINANGDFDVGEPEFSGITVNAFMAGPDGDFASEDDVLIASGETGSPYTLILPQAGEYQIAVDSEDPDLPSGLRPNIATAFVFTVALGDVFVLCPLRVVQP